MRVRDEIKKCVVFLGYQLANGEFKFAGTALFLGNEVNGHQASYLVTARHVIDNIYKLGLDTIWARLNKKGGEAEWRRTNAWRHPANDSSLDVAISPSVPIPEDDHLILHREVALTPAVSAELDVGVGDEVFITGLFANYAGKLRNVPIVRVGNLAAYPEERIRVRLFGEMDAYLIEARSIGGLSGSPVFYNPGRVRVKNGLPLFATGLPFKLMGIIHGHYRRDLESDEPDAEGGGEVEALNTVIAIVVPVGKILNFIDTVPSQLIAALIPKKSH
jgi:hypothetical protein